MYGHNSIQEVIEVLKTIDLSAIKTFKNDFFKTLKFEAYISGHLSEQEALDMCSAVSKSLEYSHLTDDDSSF